MVRALVPDQSNQMNLILIVHYLNGYFDYRFLVLHKRNFLTHCKLSWPPHPDK